MKAVYIYIYISYVHIYIVKFDRLYFKYCHRINKNLTIYLERKTNENYERKALYTLQEDPIPQNM